jgi:predicted RNase H-like nuclease
MYWTKFILDADEIGLPRQIRPPRYTIVFNGRRISVYVIQIPQPVQEFLLSPCGMNTFIGVDLGWYGKPSGLASLALDGSDLRLLNVERLQEIDEILGWIQSEAGPGSAVAAVDAPLVIRNHTGIRPAERSLNRDFRRFHAGCHAANLGRPFAPNVIAFSRGLEALGFAHGASLKPRQQGRFQIEVHPHAATVRLFRLDRIVKYKRGTRDQKAKELRRLRALALSRLPALDPALILRLPSIPRTGSTKASEGKIDCVLCAYIGVCWWMGATNGTLSTVTKRMDILWCPTRPSPRLASASARWQSYLDGS